MRLRTLAVFTLLTLPLTALATPLIDDLSILGDGHTITFSLPTLLPPGNLFGVDEYRSYASSTARIDGIGGYDLGIVFFGILDGHTRRPYSGGMEINVPGTSAYSYSFGGDPSIIDGYGGFAPYYLVTGNYTYSEQLTGNPFSVSVNPETAPSPVPEPGTLGLLLTGLLALFLAPHFQRSGSQRVHLEMRHGRLAS